MCEADMKGYSYVQQVEHEIRQVAQIDAVKQKAKEIKATIDK